jgi:hypothetical protein
MKNVRIFVLAVLAAVTLVGIQATALGQPSGSLAKVTGGGGTIRWEVQAANAGVELTIVVPDGRSLHRSYEPGASPEFTFSDKRFEGLPDGTYAYELRLRPVLSQSMKEAAQKARGKDDDPEAERAWRKRAAAPALVQTGSFAILNGSIIVPGGVEGQRISAKATPQSPVDDAAFARILNRFRNHRIYGGVRPDVVVPDDQIVQGSECVGLDCVNGEVFNFDTVRLKENNTRIGFMDTSTSAGFPTNDWTIRANSSASGGGNFLAFVDQGASGTGTEVGTIIFEVDAGAPANSLRVSSSGNVGLGTGTPVLDLHITTSDTPAHRFEQTNAGGFAAQTWDVAGNEANFFVRDVTGGSRLPFRIRPGAPTSSVDISATGNVGIGTASPGTLTGGLSVTGTALHVLNSADNAQLLLTAGGNGKVPDIKMENTTATATKRVFESLYDGASNLAKWRFANESTGAITQDNVLVLKNDGTVGIGTAAPTDTLSVNGTASKPGGGSWAVFSDERLKNFRGRFTTGLKAVMQLQPLRYVYKPDNALSLRSTGENIGFGAQELQKIIPEAVNRNGNGYLMVNNDPILWTMLNAIKEQQQEIAELKAQVHKLQTASRRRAR